MFTFSLVSLVPRWKIYKKNVFFDWKHASPWKVNNIRKMMTCSGNFHYNVNSAVFFCFGWFWEIIRKQEIHPLQTCLFDHVTLMTYLEPRSPSNKLRFLANKRDIQSKWKRVMLNPNSRDRNFVPCVSRWIYAAWALQPLSVTELDDFCGRSVNRT